MSSNILFIAYTEITHPLILSQGLEYIKDLSKNGYNFFLMTYEKTDDGINNSIRKILTDYNIKWCPLRYYSRFSLVSTLYNILCGIFVGGKIIKDNNIKLIHSRTLVPAIISFILSRFFRIKFLFDMRAMLSDEYVEGGLLVKDSFIYKIISKIEKKIIASADGLVVLTNEYIKILNKIKNNDKAVNNIKIIPCCIRLNEFVPNYTNITYPILKDNSDIKFVYLGTLGVWYCFDSMLKFFKVVVKKYYNSKFIIISKSDHDWIRSRIYLHGIPYCFFEIYNLSSEDVKRILPFMDFGIIFDRPGIRLTAFPVKFGEYLASGLPIIINSGMGDIESYTLNNNLGIVLKDFSDESLNEGIGQLNYFYKNDMAKLRCRKFVEDILSIEKGVNSYVELYETLLE